MPDKPFPGKICYNCSMQKPLRKDIQPGTEVNIVQKQHQRSGELTQGTVKRLLTKSPSHPHGIKVELTSGQVGRVQSLI